jgi:hypothetical protein
VEVITPQSLHRQNIAPLAVVMHFTKSRELTTGDSVGSLIASMLRSLMGHDNASSVVCGFEQYVTTHGRCMS